MIEIFIKKAYAVSYYQPDFKYNRSLDSLYDYIYNGVFTLLGVLAMIYIIYYGIQMIVSNGQPEAFTKARTGLLWAIIGVITTISLYFILNVMVGTANKLINIP